MKLINIVEEKCTKCNKCIKVCPVSIIRLNQQGYPEVTVNAYKLCINCGYCVDICVYEALFHKVRRRLGSARAAMRRYEVLLKNEKKKGETNEK